MNFMGKSNPRHAPTLIPPRTKIPQYWTEGSSLVYHWVQTQSCQTGSHHCAGLVDQEAPVINNTIMALKLRYVWNIDNPHKHWGLQRTYIWHMIRKYQSVSVCLSVCPCLCVRVCMSACLTLLQSWLDVGNPWTVNRTPPPGLSPFSTEKESYTATLLIFLLLPGLSWQTNFSGTNSLFICFNIKQITILINNQIKINICW